MIFAAATTTLDKLQKIPKEFWLKAGGAIAAVIIVFIVIQKVLKINKFVLGGVLFVGGGLMWFNWIYHRTEPKFLTPLVDRIAPFFPCGRRLRRKAGDESGRHEEEVGPSLETAWF